IDLFFGPGADPVLATRRFFAAAAQTLRETDYADACPIATVALEVSSTNEPMRQACADVFTSWLARTAQCLRGAGVAPARARSVSLAMLASLEGAFVLARALRSTAPLRAAGEAAAASVAGALEHPRRRAA